MSIDYGYGNTNRNPETGIRYGIVLASDVPNWVHEEAESIYFLGCPECGSEAEEGQEEGDECRVCGTEIEYGDEPLGWKLESDGIVGWVDSMGDLWIYSSPWVAFGAHASPCAPGAVVQHPPGVDGTAPYRLDPGVATESEYSAPFSYTLGPDDWQEN